MHIDKSPLVIVNFLEAKADGTMMIVVVRQIDIVEQILDGLGGIVILADSEFRSSP